MAASAMSFTAACAGVRVGVAGSAGRGRAVKARHINSATSNVVVRAKALSATGAPERKESMAGVSGVAKAKRAQRGKVIVEAVPDSFSPLQQPGGEPDGPKGFWETFFGVDPNKGKIRAPIQFRFLSCLPYLIPMMGAIAFTGQSFLAFPFTFKIAVGISPLLQIFYSNSFIPFATFFTLFLAVVRNIKINHFLRYNTMQAILLDICVMLAGLIMQYLPMYITTSFIGSWMELFILMNALYAILYCMCNCLSGVYPEIPIITEAVYAQVRDTN